jgi:hypothetical protein
MVTGAASVAAAVAAVGLATFHTLGSNQAFDLRPATVSPAPTMSSTRSPNPVLPLPVRGPLPVSAEWRVTLGITETVQITELRPGEGVFADCPVRAPGAQIATGSVHASRPGSTQPRRPTVPPHQRPATSQPQLRSASSSAASR